jgi:hypothetical protein
MTASPIYYLGDVGATITAKTNYTFPTPTTFTILIEKPSGATTDSWTVDGSNTTTGDITHYTDAGDFDEVGQYKRQIKADYVATSGSTPSFTIWFNIESFTVHERLF